MRFTRIAILLSTISILLICAGLVSALSQNEASVKTFLTNQNPNPGQTLGVTIYFSNNSTDTLTLTSVGLHFDWMDPTGFYGFNLTSVPITVQPGGSQLFNQPINMLIPVTTTPGAHTFYVEAEGRQGSANTAFVWDSAPISFQLGTGGGTTPTPTNSPNSSGSQGGGDNLLLYGIIIVIVVIVVLVVVFVFMRMRKKPSKSPQSAESQSQTPPSSPKPESSPNPTPESPKEEENYSI